MLLFLQQLLNTLVFIDILIPRIYLLCSLSLTKCLHSSCCLSMSLSLPSICAIKVTICKQEKSFKIWLNKFLATLLYPRPPSVTRPELSFQQSKIQWARLIPLASLKTVASTMKLPPWLFQAPKNNTNWITLKKTSQFTADFTSVILQWTLCAFTSSLWFLAAISEVAVSLFSISDNKSAWGAISKGQKF